jgi:cyclic pyranopterin phosphate synthase
MSGSKAGRLSHVDARRRVKMVDVGDKPVTNRDAIARGTITMSLEALRLIRSGAVKKGDPLQTARLAGILAAKQTSSLIPLCHSLPLSSVNVELRPKGRGYEIEARVRTTSQTGVEMEALTAVAVAALTVYDMVKAVDKAMVIGDIRLMSKTGGRSGAYTRQEGRKVAKQEGKGRGQKGKGHGQGQEGTGPGRKAQGAKA